MVAYYSIYETYLSNKLSSKNIYKLTNSWSSRIGPRQVGKTTLLRIGKNQTVVLIIISGIYWDQEKILSGYKYILQSAVLDIASYQKPILALDETQKYKRRETFLKGLYDSYKTDVRVLVSGRAKLDIYRQGGDR